MGAGLPPRLSEHPGLCGPAAPEAGGGAFTATATSEVREDIQRLLELEAPLSITTGFDRDNLYLEVCRPSVKRVELLARVRERPGECGIVYCSTRKNVEEVCQFLQSSGISATRYHAGWSRRSGSRIRRTSSSTGSR